MKLAVLAALEQRTAPRYTMPGTTAAETSTGRLPTTTGTSPTKPAATLGGVFSSRTIGTYNAALIGVFNAGQQAPSRMRTRCPWSPNGSISMYSAIGSPLLGPRGFLLPRSGACGCTGLADGVDHHRRHTRVICSGWCVEKPRVHAASVLFLRAGQDHSIRSRSPTRPEGVS